MMVLQWQRRPPFFFWMIYKRILYIWINGKRMWAFSVSHCCFWSFFTFKLDFMRLAWQLLWDVIFWWPWLWAANSRWGEWSSESQQNRQSTDTQGFKLSEAGTQRESQDRSPDRQAEWSQSEGGGVRHAQKKTIWLHAWAIRAAAVALAAIPEQSPQAAQLWGATPESPYWSLEWAETHFLWAQVTWRKEQKGLRQVVVKWWKGVGVGVWGVRGWGNVVGRGGEKERGVSEKKTNKKTRKQKQKNYRRHLPSRSRLVKTNYVNRVEGSENLTQSTDQHTNIGMQE